MTHLPGDKALAAQLPENSYGVRKRFEYVSEVMTRLQPANVLDIGCGTGTLLTFPLAERFPQTRFVAVDEDTRSIEYARRQNTYDNLGFHYPSEVSAEQRFDLVIASEVIEHVENPDGFLAAMRDRLSPRGRVLLTLPNGYGPFEWAKLLESLLRLGGAYRPMARLKRILKGKTWRPVEGSDVDTLASSPHLNFFTFAAIQRVIHGAALEVEEYRARSFLCGDVVFDPFLRGERLLQWNLRVAERLPPMLNSSWMLLLRQSSARQVPPYRRGPYAQLRRRLNVMAAERS